MVTIAARQESDDFQCITAQAAAQIISPDQQPALSEVTVWLLSRDKYDQVTNVIRTKVSLSASEDQMVPVVTSRNLIPNYSGLYFSCLQTSS
ncbi:hypothetical protein T4B_5237 [Trichinella pseudospiralis]|uniref:Uncharacterized protein n=1 Tax=Trichinella pseudospiralis TaxID=6337 RepID=A0A0V1J047_TRIPS|nr:hypothetical protein T4A_4097 [Trichinella pseudospiralis]KRZ19936.1 hypothetical protein T4B_5237 [Trichinella pseudospiralis]KRZ28216.1 hypothetical protein T4C_12238 [Trichinella pseudospiralis]